VVLGALVLSAGQFALTDASHAVASLAIFLAAGSRIAPAILRIQQSLLTMQTSLGQAEPTFGMLDSIGLYLDEEDEDSVYRSDHSGFNGEIEFRDVSFTLSITKRANVKEDFFKS
jgi:ABC-type multidrug transport system fused ATPase/permease subunit